MQKPHNRRRWKRPRRAPGAAREVPKEELAEVREVVVALDRAEKAAGLYPVDSPVLQGIAEDLHARLTPLLKRQKVVELHVGADEIEYEGEVVLDGSRSERSLAFVMEDGGLRRLVFFEGLDGKEALALVGAFHEARKAGAEDLVTILWQKELRHVSHVAVHVYRDPEGDARLEALDLADVARGLVDRLKGRRVSIDQVAQVRRGGQADSQVGTAPDDGAGVRAATDEEAEVFALTAAEGAEARRWIADQAAESGAELVAGVLLALLPESPSDDARRARLATLQSALQSLLDDGDALGAAEVVVGVRALADKVSEAGDGSIRGHGPAGALRSFLAAAASKETGPKLAKVLARAKDETAVGAVRLFLKACGKPAFGLASDLLGCSSHDAKVVDALAEAVGGDLSEVRRHAADGAPKVAIAALRILSERTGEGAYEEIAGGLDHKDPGVRREAAAMLARHTQRRAMERLAQAIEDPVAEVRAAVLRAITASAGREPRPDLWERVKRLVDDEKGFDARANGEQEALLTALGRLDPARGPALLAEMAAAHFSLLQRERAHRRRLRAIAALGETASAKAEEALKAVAAGAKGDDIVGACRAALDRLAVARKSAAAAMFGGDASKRIGPPRGSGPGDGTKRVGAAKGGPKA